MMILQWENTLLRLSLLEKYFYKRNVTKTRADIIILSKTCIVFLYCPPTINALY